MNKRISLILLAGFILRLYFILSTHYISPDGTQYVSLGYNLWHHGAYVSNGSQFLDVIQPPLYPALSGIFTLFFNPEAAGKAASLIFGLLLILAIYRFGISLKLPQSVALGSAWIAALHPALIAVSAQAVTESLYLLLLFYGFAYGWQIFRLPANVKAALLGLIWLLAFLTRPEGLFFFIFHLFFGVALLVKRKLRWTHLVSFILPFFMGSLLYGIAVSAEVGHFTLSPKLSYIRVQARMARFVKSQPPGANSALYKNAGDDLFKFALSEDKKQLKVDEMFFHPEAAKIKSAGQWSASHLFKALASQIYKNIRLSLYKLYHGLSFPLIFLLLLIFGLVYRRHIPRDLCVYLFLMILPVFSFLISHVEDRFLYGLVIMTVLLMGDGMAKFGNLPLIKKIAGMSNGLESVRGSIIPVLLVLLFSLPSYSALSRKMQAKNYYYYAGSKLQKVIPVTARVAAVKPQAVFFAERNYSVYPFASLGDLLVYLKHQQVRYLLLEDKDLKVRPDAAELLSQRKGVRLIKKFNVSSHRFYLLSVEEGE